MPQKESCTTSKLQIFRLLTHHMWHKALDDGLQVDAVFLDFAKAFDRVHHKILLNKLCNFGISGSLLEWGGGYFASLRARASSHESRASFCEPRKIPAKKSKNGHNALIWYLLHAGSITRGNEFR